MRKPIYILAIAAIISGCTPNRQAGRQRLIAPLPAGITVDNLQDCTIPVAFKLDGFNWEEGKLKMIVYNQDLYDGVEISQIRTGDTIIYDGTTFVIEKITQEHGGIDINGGIDEGGCCLTGNEGGTYVARHWDDHATYTKLGEAVVALADDFVILDCGSFPEDPIDTIRTNQRQYIENLEDGRKDFFQLNTRVTIKNGMITEISRRWIP